jgi:hypothetical protein
MRAESFTMLFTIDIIKPDSHTATDKLCSLSYLHFILIFFSKSVAVCLRDGSLYPLGTRLLPAMMLSMKIVLTNKNKRYSTLQ